MPDYDNGAYFEDISDHISNKIGGIYFLEPGALTPLTEMAPFFPEDVSIGLDEAYGEGIIFYYPAKQGVTDTVTFKSQWFPIEPHSTFNQIIQKSGSGKLSVYDSSFQDRILVSVPGLPDK